MDTTPSLHRQLNQLERADLVRLAAAQPELAYMFRHALVQESAYRTLVRADRRRVHRAAGEALEALLAGREPPPDLVPELARHFEEAADEARAIHYYTLAGDSALARYANVEAVAAFTRALACAERAPAAADWRHLFTARGRALELNSQFDEALRNYEAMGQRARAQSDHHLALAASVLVGQLYSTVTPLFNPSQGERLNEAALIEARTLGDEAAEAKILWNQLNIYRFTGRNRQAREFGERSLIIARRLGMREQAALTQNDLIHVYAGLGLWTEARAASAEAGRLWRELSNLAMLADSLSSMALYGSTFGELESAVQWAGEAQELSLRIGNLWGQSYSLSAMAWPYWYMGQPDRAIQVSEDCIRLGGEAGYLFAQVLDRSRLAFMYGELGDYDRGLSLAHQAVQASAQMGNTGLGPARAIVASLEARAGLVEEAAATLQAMEEVASGPMILEQDSIMRARIDVSLARHDTARACELAQAHIALLRSMGLRLFLPEALGGQARALRLLGRAAEARQCLLEARAIAEGMGARMVEWQALSTLGELEAAEGHPDQAEPLWARAREVAGAIAARIATPALQGSFLARPDLRALFGASSSPASTTSLPSAPAAQVL